jgi:hypothetical protein
MPTRFKHDPDATLDYAVDWTSWLAAGETISSVVWDVPTGLTEESAPGGWSEPDANNARTVWLSGGTAGTDYTVGCEITTSVGRVDERSIIIEARQR